MKRKEKENLLQPAGEEDQWDKDPGKNIPKDYKKLRSPSVRTSQNPVIPME